MTENDQLFVKYFCLLNIMWEETDFDTSFIYFQVRKIKQYLDPNVENNGNLSKFKLDLFFSNSGKNK